MKRKIRKKGQADAKINVEFIVDMEGRGKIEIYVPEESEMLDSDILQLQNLAQQQKEEIKRVYYSSNTPISSTINRTFFDLVKRFIQLKLLSKKSQT